MNYFCLILLQMRVKYKILKPQHVNPAVLGSQNSCKLKVSKVPPSPDTP